MIPPLLTAFAAAFVLLAPPVAPHSPSHASPPAVSPADTDDPLFQTFSIAAIDPETGESGVAVTTRVPCVGNAVPWVRPGVGAVATQAFTRVEYGVELLDLMEEGMDPEAALEQRLAEDDDVERRQVGVIDTEGRTAQHTGAETSDWTGHRAGEDFVVQGNLLVGEKVVDAVAVSFERTRGSGRHLVDRLVEALEAGQEVGGDARKGRLQSAAVIVADPREGRARNPDGVTANINVCEHPEAVAELRRQHDAIAGILGHRTLEQPEGNDVAQLRVILHHLGYLREDPLEPNPEAIARYFTPDVAEAVDRFRADAGLSTPEVGTPPGLMDREAVDRLWEEVERRGLTERVREEIRELTAILR